VYCKESYGFYGFDIGSCMLRVCTVLSSTLSRNKKTTRINKRTVNKSLKLLVVILIARLLLLIGHLER
jgi:hypothetical protein